MTAISTPLFDLQINGWNGVDFNRDDLSGEQLHRLCKELATRGVTQFLATLITDDLAKLLQRLERLAVLIEADPLARQLVAGIHLEGPFLNPDPGFIGAHRADAVLPASPAVAAQLFDAAAGMLSLVTLAPETDHELQTIRWFTERGVRIAAGHCNPSQQTLQAAIDAGLTLFTHLGNACPTTLPRHDNIIQRALSLSDRLFVTFIADSHHIPLFALANYLRLVGPERAILVSDVTAAGGIGPGSFTLNGREVRIDEQGIARLGDQTGLLAGSTCLLDSALKLLHSELQLSPELLHRLTWTNPRKALGLANAHIN
jgi:N-acetylglucosamine-6-phosphate deacetylase